MDEGKAIASCSSTTTDENTIEEITDQTECPVDCYINRIPSELLNIIFSFLSIKQRIGIERVCKHWRFVNNFIPWHKTYTLIIGKEEFERMNDYILMQILCRCGSVLRKFDFCFNKHESSFDIPFISLSISALRNVDFSFYENDSSYDILLLLSIYCPNLEFVSLEKIVLKDKHFKIFSEKCNRLKEVRIYDCNFDADESLKYLFKNCNLRRFSLNHSYSFKDASLVYLKDDIESIDLSYCKTLQSENIITLSERRNLRDLRLNYTNLEEKDLINIFSAFKTKLTHLEIEGLSENVTENTLKEGLTCYENLTHLNLAHNENVTDNVINVVIKNCSQLELLNINDTSITDASLILLRELKNIRSLHISYMENLSEAGFIKLTDFDALETLEVRRSPQFSDTACIALLQNCNSLKLLDISSCDNITNATIQAVSTIIRDDYIIIIAGGTRITEFEKSPSLLVEDINLYPFCDITNYTIAIPDFHYRYDFHYDHDYEYD